LKQLNGAIYAPSKLYFKTEEEDEKFLDITEQTERASESQDISPVKEGRKQSIALES